MTSQELMNPSLRCPPLHVISLPRRFVVDNNMLIDLQTGRLISYFGQEADVTVPESVVKIGVQAFCGCKSLRRVFLPDTVKYIEDFAFKGCTSLQHIQFSASLRGIGSCAFLNCKSLKEIHLPKSVSHVSRWAFWLYDPKNNVFSTLSITDGGHYVLWK